MDDRYYVNLRGASRVLGLSEQQLRTWDTSGVVRPQIADRLRRPMVRVYTFEDLLVLLVVADLARDVPMVELRKVQPWLMEHRTAGWENLTVTVAKDRIKLIDRTADDAPEAQAASDAKRTINLAEAVARLRAKIERSRQRDPRQIGKITRHPDIMENDWVLAGTRVPTKSVWDMHDEGYSLDAILRQFPMLTAEDVQAAIEHQAALRRKGAA